MRPRICSVRGMEGECLLDDNFKLCEELDECPAPVSVDKYCTGCGLLLTRHEQDVSYLCEKCLKDFDLGICELELK